jgi:hypothetical protein
MSERPYKMQDGQVYLNSATREQQVYRDRTGRSAWAYYWLRLKDFLR